MTGQLAKHTPMKIRTVFGCLFFLLSIAFCAVQLVSLPSAESLDGTRTILEFISALVCLGLASFAAESSQRATTVLISVVALSVCFIALATCGILAMKQGSEMTTAKYVIFFAYAVLYGFFGLAFSIVASKAKKGDAGQNA
jgi:hypothetical protein